MAQATTRPWSLHEALSAPASLTLSGSSRWRYETLSNQARAGISANDDLLNIRTTLLTEYSLGKIGLTSELYDSRGYGGDAAGSVGTGDVNALEFVQAYATLSLADQKADGFSTSAKLGRYVLNLGSRRILAADEYRTAPTGFTGLRVDLADGALWNTTLLYVLPQSRRPDNKAGILKNQIALDHESFDLALWGGIANAANVVDDATGELHYFRLDERDTPARPTQNRALDTFGARIIRNPRLANFDYEAELIRQSGSIRDGLSETARALNVSAWFAHVDAGYSFAVPWALRLSFEYDYGSGDDAGGDFTRFDGLFGGRRAELAPTGIYSALGRSNLSTPAIRLEATPSARLDWFLNYRLLWLASSTDAFSATGVRDVSGQSDRFAGQQIEGRIHYWLVPNALQFELDAAMLLKGAFYREAPNAPATGDTIYTSLNMTVFF